MMEICLRTIVALYNASEVWWHPAESPSHYRKLDFDISMQWEALFRYKQHDRLILHSRLPGTTCSWNKHPVKPLLFLWKFSSLLDLTLFISISTIECPHSIVLRIIDTIDVEKLLIRKGNFHCFLFSKNFLNPICKFFFFPVRSFHCRRVIVRLFSYRNKALDGILLFSEHWCAKYIKLHR